MTIKRRTTTLLLTMLSTSTALSAEHRQHQPVTLDFTTVSTEETARDNPFLNYRLQVTFSRDGVRYSIPGFYAADGDAADSGATGGGIWRVIFTPPSAGQWEYRVAFTHGDAVAINDDPRVGEPVAPHHGTTGTLDIVAAAEDATHFASSGGLVHRSGRYFQTRDGEPLLLTGTNSPENLLAYKDFDGVYSADPDRAFLKTWEPHVGDWHPDDPTWRDGRGKGIIGAFNYLASQGMNFAYLLTLNIDGDAQDVWPFLSHERSGFTRYDVSRLAQWSIVFTHAERLGVVLELMTQEQENQLLLDDGYLGRERRLYYRELVARFGHHKNLIWNIGEENGAAADWGPQGQSDQQRFAMIRYLADLDAYDHPILIHTLPTADQRAPILEPLLRYKPFNGISLQSHEPKNVHENVKHWLARSAAAEHQWVVTQDENGPWHTGTEPDSVDPDHDHLRKHILWGALMGGAAGVQWYFGWNTSPHDLDAEDWRSRENMWRQTAIARQLFEQLDFHRMHSTDELIDAAEAFCFSEPGATYLVYLPSGGTARLDLTDHQGDYSVEWYDPRQGGQPRQGSVREIRGGDWTPLGTAPADPDNDWAIVVKRK